MCGNFWPSTIRKVGGISRDLPGALKLSSPRSGLGVIALEDLPGLPQGRHCTIRLSLCLDVVISWLSTATNTQWAAFVENYQRTMLVK